MAARYKEITGKPLSSLASGQRERILSLPPDFDSSDISYVLGE